MKNDLLEIAAVQYSAASTKGLLFNVQPRSECFRLHWHDRMELLRIRHGKMCVKYGTASVVLSAGELMIIPPKVLHKGYTLDENAEYTCIMFDVRSFYNETEVCKKLLPAIFDGRATFKSVTSDMETIQCFDAIFKDSNTGSLETISKIYQLINLFYQNNLLELRAYPKNASVKKIVDYIEENATQEINIDLLCEKFVYSKAYLCRKFKQATGLSPLAYLKIYRLELARKKILDSDISISNIAAECGFSDANYFTRCFKAHFGVPPTRYDKAHANLDEIRSET